MLTSTLGAVLFTVLIVGGLTVPALRPARRPRATSRSTAAIIIELIATRRDRSVRRITRTTSAPTRRRF